MQSNNFPFKLTNKKGEKSLQKRIFSLFYVILSFYSLFHSHSPAVDDINARLETFDAVSNLDT